MKLFKHGSLGALALSMVFSFGCSSGSDGKVSGVVINIDTLTAAAGVKVYLLSDSEVVSEAATGADGLFELEVPEGEDFVLVTDDFDSGDDEWFPTINFDINRLTMGEDDIEGLQIHACPQPGSESLGGSTTTGSVATWDNYLENAAADPRYDNVPSSEESGGILSLLFVQSFPDITLEQIFTGNLVLALDEGEDFNPIGYVNTPVFYNPETFRPDTSLAGAPEFMLPDGFASLAAGFAFAFGNPAYDGSTVTLNITDTDTDRGLDFGGPYTVPVRDGHITLILSGSIDGEGKKDFAEVVADLVAKGVLQL